MVVLGAFVQEPTCSIARRPRGQVFWSPSLCPKMEIKVLVRTPTVSLDRRSRPRHAMHGIVLCVCLRPFVHVKLVHCVCPRLLDSDLDLTFPRRSGPWERSRPEPAPATALARARPEKGGGGSGRCEWELAAWGRRRRARKGRCWCLTCGVWEWAGSPTQQLVQSGCERARRGGVLDVLQSVVVVREQCRKSHRPGEERVRGDLGEERRRPGRKARDEQRQRRDGLIQLTHAVDPAAKPVWRWPSDEDPRAVRQLEHQQRDELWGANRGRWARREDGRGDQLHEQSDDDRAGAVRSIHTIQKGAPLLQRIGCVDQGLRDLVRSRGAIPN